MLLDTVMECCSKVSKACAMFFEPLPHADPKAQACGACKTQLYSMISKILEITTAKNSRSPQVLALWTEMSKARFPRAWMFSHNLYGMFLANIAGVDDTKWAPLWLSNGVGLGYGWNEFSTRLLRDHTRQVMDRLKGKIVPPPALAPATASQVKDLVQAISTRPAPDVRPILKEAGPDVGDLQPDVEVKPEASLPTAEEHLKTLGDINALPAAESFEPAPQAISADEVRATSGPASQPRRTKVAAGDGQLVTRKASAHVRVSRRVLAEAAKAEEDLQQK
jgi:hypothetical protein